MAKAEYSDAIALLKADHRKVEELFEQFEKAATGKKKGDIAHQCPASAPMAQIMG